MLGATLAIGNDLLEAKEGPKKPPHGEFQAMVGSDLPFGPRSARMFMAIARDGRLTKRKHVSVLPPSWGTLYQISRLDDPTFEKAIDEGVINPTAERAEIARLVSKGTRTARHRKIAALATTASFEMPEHFGPFPLIYADAPWKFHAYDDESGAARTPDQHYPTLTDQEIIDFKVYGQTIQQIAAKNAALFMWCTSSNIDRALEVMKGWGFTFKSSAAWDKMVTGLGLVFRNQHELILYGTRGNMPGPQYQPPSLFHFSARQAQRQAAGDQKNHRENVSRLR